MTLCLFSILILSPLAIADDDSLWENLEDVPEEEDKTDEGEADGSEENEESSPDEADKEEAAIE